MDIETARLHVRDLVESDLPAVFEMQSAPAILRFVGWPPAASEADSARWLADTLEHNNAEPRFSHGCAVVLKSTAEVAGWIGFGHPSAGKEEYGDLDFGYAMLPRHWGHGYMAEALRGTLDFIFETPDIFVIRERPPVPGVPRRRRQADSVFGECAAANPASARVMEKAGMSRVAEFDDPEGGISYRYLIGRQQWTRTANL